MTHADTSKAVGLVKLGGSIGIASAFIGLAIFLVGLVGIHPVFMLSILPILLGGIGMVVTVIGAVMHTPGGADETTPISAIFCCMFGLIFGAIEWYIWSSFAVIAAAAGK